MIFLAFPLVVGDCGVPYLLSDLEKGVGKRVEGELWLIDAETLRALDEYEGVAKQYYKRHTIGVRSSRNATRTAQCYFKCDSTSTPALRRGAFDARYSLARHRSLYKPIAHIQAKQQLYLNEAIQH
jgi:gamma-glutamylcyclotransferase (GGCT)/AIG2-like uncharacterized protein YtfP